MTGKKITKTELIDRVYEKTGIIRKDIKTTLDLALEGIKEALAGGTVIELRGFGTFEVRRRKGRQKARNPKTGEYVSVTSHGIAAFRPGREMKQAVWNVVTEGAPDTPPPGSPDRPAEALSGNTLSPGALPPAGPAEDTTASSKTDANGGALDQQTET
jgi:integration host factor subunit beta